MRKVHESAHKKKLLESYNFAKKYRSYFSRKSVSQRKPGTMGKERRSHSSAMQWQADHGTCLELVQSNPVTRMLYTEAQPSPSGTCRGHKHG